MKDGVVVEQASAEQILGAAARGVHEAAAGAMPRGYRRAAA